uniref:Peptidase aspartic putative domain-containing protein n=1 Tax=Panagrolaimus davidi TaxID=227884 RepID=A0A914QH39_9BILA
MSFSKKSVFTKARTKAFEKAAAALQVIIPTFTTPQEVVPFMASIPPIRKELNDAKGTCKKYYDEWLAFLEELERKKDPNFNTESKTLNDLLQKPDDGIQACFNKCKAGIKHLINLNDQLPGIMSLLLQQQNNPPPPQPTPSAPVDDTTNPVPEPPPTTASATENVTPDPNKPANGTPPSTTIPVVNQPTDATKNVTSDPTIPSTNTVQQPLYPSTTSTPSLNPSLPPASTVPSNQPLHQHAQQYQFYNFPKMEFPTFNGNPTDYQYWRSSIAAIHDHPYMDPTTKMKMVTDLLRGKAKEAVCYFDICAANYDLVMDELYERFGKRELVFESLFNEFANIKVQSNDIKDIATAVFAMEKIFKQLQTHNFPIDEHTYRILYREKIPPHILQQVNFYGLDPSFAELRQRVVLVVRSLTEIPNTQQYNAQHQIYQHRNVQRQHIPRRNSPHDNILQENVPHRAPHQNFQPLMASDLYRPKYDRQKSTDKDCVFCGKHNNSFSCNTVPEIKERKRIAHAKDLCFKCLQPGHSGSTCKDVRPCSLCKGNHNAAFCFPSEKPSTMHAVNTVNVKIPTHSKDVAMMVKPAPVCNPHRPLLQKEANIFFDGGSTASFIKESLVMQLKLPIIQEENLFLQKFAENNKPAAPPIPSKKVKMLIKTVHMETVEVIAYTVKRISDVLPVMNPTGMDQAEPDILIGNDYCWTFLPSKKLPNGYSEVTTLLGKIICGQKDQSVSNSAKSFIEETSPSISQPYEKEVELNSQVKRMQQKIKDMEALFVTTEDDLLAEIRGLKEDNKNLLAAKCKLKKKSAKESNENHELLKEIDSMKTKLHNLSTQNDHYRIALKENATQKEDLNFFMATVDELKQENQILKTEKSRDSSTIKSLRSLLINKKK